MVDFNQAEYWRERHQKLRGDPRSVGNLARSREDNLASEASVVATVDRAAGLLAPARSVLDLGCGYGRVSRCFTGRGYRYLGLDVSPDAVSQARERNPAAEFQVADLAAWNTDRRFDVVAVLYVFVHFVDDGAWRSLLERALSWLTPDGAILIADQFPAEREKKLPHVVGRPLSEYRDLLAARGFAFDEAFRQRLIGTGGEIQAQARAFHLARRVGTSSNGNGGGTGSNPFAF